MKTVVSKIIAVWAIVLLACLVLLNAANDSSLEHTVAQQNQWLRNQQALVSQTMQDADLASVSGQRNLVSEVSLLPSVYSVELVSNEAVLEQFVRTAPSQSLFHYQIPLYNASPRGLTLQIAFDLQAFQATQEIFFSWYWVFTVALLIAGGVLHYWILNPMFELEQKAEAILTGDFEPENFTLSDEHPLTSELAINLLLNEYNDIKLEQTDLSNRLRQHSFVDAITGLGNREYFDAELEIHLKSPDESVHGSVVLFSFEPILDLQHNDKAAFMAFLKQIGQYFQSFIDEEDLCWVARRGSVDFSLLILEQAPDKVRRLCQKIIKDLGRVVFDATEFSHHFTSVGITFFTTGDNAYDVLASADMSLRNAQLEGENKIHMYQSQRLSKDEIKGSVRWRSFLQTILDKRQVILLYQPQIDAEGSQEQQFEVLSRIEERGKMIAASVFLPMANRCGLASEFDRLIIDKALKELSFGEEFSETRLSINLFSDSLLNEKFVSWLKQRLSLNKSINERITFEISEFAASRQTGALKGPMEDIADLGCQWCVEHVGSPTADLSYIADLPLNRLKIGQTTVRAIEQQHEKQLFVQTLITAAHQSGLSVWAEGVESESEWNMLLELGIEGAQGFWFGSPQDKLLLKDTQEMF